MLARVFDLFSLSPVMLGSSAVSIACGGFLISQVATSELGDDAQVVHDAPAVQKAVSPSTARSTFHVAPSAGSEQASDDFNRGDASSSPYSSTSASRHAAGNGGRTIKQSRPVSFTSPPTGRRVTDPYSHDESGDLATARVSNSSLFSYDAGVTPTSTSSASSSVSSSSTSTTAGATDFISTSPSDTTAPSEDDGSTPTSENELPDPEASEFLLTEADVDISIEESQSVRCFAPSNQGGLPCMCELTTVIKGKPFTELINNCN